jgi:PAS domain S-box-containing protein
MSPSLDPVRHSATILVVDDAESNRCARCRVLSHAQYRVIEASTGEEALLMVAGHRPDLIVLDVDLPDIDGLEVCRRLKADHHTSRIMVLQVSSVRTSKLDLAAGIEGGADSYLIEPIHPLELLATVKALLRLADREQENLRLIRQLSRSERQFAEATNATDSGLWDWDIASGNLEWFGTHERLAGMVPGGFSGKIEVFSEILHPDDRARIWNKLQRMMDRREACFSDEYRFVHPDGSIHWMTANGRFFYDDIGHAVRMTGVVQDITARKQVEDKLAQYRTIIAAATDAIAIIDPHADYIEQNLAHRAMLGYSDKELFGHTPALHLGEETFQQVARELIDTGRYVGDVRSRRKDGRWVDLALSAFGLYDDKGEVLCYVGMMRDITERKKAEDFARRITDVSPSILYVYDLEERRNVWGSREMFVGLGYGQEQIDAMAGHLLRELLHPDDWPRYLDYAERLTRLADGEVAEFQCRLRHADGSYRSLHSRDTVFTRTIDGTVKQIAGSALDITDRKLAEDAMLAAHDTFRHLVEQSPFGVYAIDADFRLVQISAGARKVFENVRPLLGRDFAEVMRQIWPEPFAGEAIGLFRHTLETGEPYHAPSTVERRRDSGELESYDWKIERIRLPDGRWGVVCHFYDLSERQRYEAALRESEERFRNMADHAPVMVWVTEPDGSCNFLSQSWYSFTGQSPESGLGFGWLDAVHPDDRASSEGTFKRATDTQSAFRLEYRLRRYDGAYRWAIDAATPRFSRDGRFLGYIGSVIDITERKRAEEALSANEEKYRHIFENAGVSLFEEDWSEIERWFDDLRSEGVTDLGGYLDANPEKVVTSIPLIRVTDVNEYAVKLLQAPSKSALLGALGRVFTPETTAVFRKELIAFWEGRDLLEQPSRLRTVKGDLLSVLCSVKVPRHRGEWDRVLVAVTDVTALHEAELAVRESEERFRTLADNISQFAWMADEKGWLFWYNRRWFDYTGTTWDDMQGWGWDKVHHPDHLHRVIKKWRHALETGHVWEDTFPLRGQDGDYRWFLSRAVPIRDADGRIFRWFGTNTDITELREAEQAQAHLAAIVTSSEDAIISKDLDGVITSWNRAAERLFGYTEPEAVGRPITMLMPLDRMDEEQDILERIRQGGFVHYETTRRRKDGTLLDISLTVSPIKDEEGRITGASKVARDITERRRQEEELRRLKEELEVRVQERTGELLATQGRLMAVTSQLSLTEQRERRKLARDLHDYLAQLLVVGQMKTGMLKKQAPHNPASATLLQDLDKVFQQALAYTRTLIAELSPPSLQDSGLPAALKWLGERFEKDGLRVEVRTDCESVPLAEEQAVVVFQAVRELLFNVMKHAGVDQARVSLSLSDDDVLRVAVADKGKGLRSDAAQRSAEPGHLGLVSVRERFHAMGGHVDVESVSGQGTTVTLALPLTVSGGKEDKGSPALTPPNSPLATHHLIRVLLVDDHTLVRQGLKDILAADDRIRVVGEAASCEEALLLAANLAPDVVITDINLPAVNGIETTKRFKKLHPQAAVIGLSVHIEAHIQQAMRSAGAETLLSKECAAEELAAAIVTCHDERVRAGKSRHDSR